MKKVLSFVTIFFILFGSFPFISQTYAVDCSLSTIPAQITTNDEKITLVIQTSGLVKNDARYGVNVNGDPIRTYNSGGTSPLLVIGTNDAGILTVDNVNRSGIVNAPSTEARFQQKDYQISVRENKPGERNGGPTFCTMKLTVAQATSSGSSGGNSCDLTFTKPNFGTDEDINLKVANLKISRSPLITTSDADKYRIKFRRNNINGSDVSFPLSEDCYTKKDMEAGISLGKHEAGLYYVEIRNACNLFGSGENMACYGTTTVGSEKDYVSPPPHPPCLNVPLGTPIGPEGCQGVATGIGDLSTKPENFIITLFTILLGLSGGIAVLIFIAAGYKYMTSQGNPEAVKGAQEMIVSAIAGLLFIIFSFVILQVIGVDILKIPGFS